MAEGTVREAITVGDVLGAELEAFDATMLRRAHTMLTVLEEGLAALMEAGISVTWEQAQALLGTATHAERYEREIALAAETAREGGSEWRFGGGLTVNVLSLEGEYASRYAYRIRESGTSRLRYEGAFGNVQEVLLTLLREVPADSLTDRVDALLALFGKLIEQPEPTPPE